MKEIGDFLKACDCFFVVTNNGDYPAARPFGVVMTDEKHLYLATNNQNQAHRQMQEDGHLQIVAKNPESRDWIRITGDAVLSEDKGLKARFLEENPRLQKHYSGAEDPHYLLFEITPTKVEFN